MWEEILKAIPVYFSTMLKFILGPLGGYALGLNLVTTILTTVAGMMTVVFVFTYSGNWLREKFFYRFFSKKKKVSKMNLRFAALWKKYGLPLVALLTPLILTPIGGTLLAVSLGGPKEKIIFYMFLSAAVWSVLFSMGIYFFGNEILDRYLPDIMKP